MRAPKPVSFPTEDYEELGESFAKFLRVLTPFTTDVTAALSGGLSTENFRRQVEKTTITTAASLADTFANGKVSFKNRLGVTPTEVRVGQISNTSSLAVPNQVGVWLPLTLVNGWVDLGDGYGTPSYRIDDGWVSLRGMIKDGTIGFDTVATLPVGFRPENHHCFAVDSNNTHGQCNINTSGVISARGGSTVYFSLSGVRFLAANPVSSLQVAAAVSVDWDITDSGLIRIKNIPGLAASTKYRLTFIIE